MLLVDHLLLATPMAGDVAVAAPMAFWIGRAIMAGGDGPSQSCSIAFGSMTSPLGPSGEQIGRDEALDAACDYSRTARPPTLRGENRPTTRIAAVGRGDGAGHR
jgi:hypothetical protein